MCIRDRSQGGNPVTLLAGNAGAIGTTIPAANANSLTGLATLRPDIGGPITISPTAAATGIGVQYFPNLVCDPRPGGCLLYTSPSPRDRQKSRMPSSA